jgi:hypothetical protein
MPAFIIPLLVLVAAAGYLAGRTHSSGGSAAAARTARSANVVFQYPAGWSQASGGPQLAGLALEQATLVAPRGHAASAGMLVGSLPRGGAAPLPASFVAQLSRLPQTAIVELIEAQAYRYTQVQLRGFGEALTVFVIPSADGASTALACYAPSASSPHMRSCEQSVSAVAVANQSQTVQLAPEPKYAAELSKAILALDRLRVSLERELHPQITAARAGQLARRLQTGFGEAGSALARMQPSAPVEGAQSALAAAIEKASAGYAALASAAGELSVPAYEAAQAHVAAAEAGVNKALASFALLGYIRAENVSLGG